MNRFFLKALTMVSGVSFAASALAQFETAPPCFDPDSMMPISNPYLIIQVGNSDGALMGCTIGVAGNVALGNGACFGPAITAENRGFMTFFYGGSSQGSVQTSPTGFEDRGMALVFGAASFPCWTYAATSVDGTRERFGANALGTTFVGFSNRYMRTETTNTDVFARVQVESVADAIRLRWTLTNTNATDARNIGLYFGGCVSTAVSVNQWDHFPVGRGYNAMPKNKQAITDTLYDRNLNASTFPSYVDFTIGQSDYFGIRIENEPSVASTDVDSNKPATADQFYMGKNTFLLGTVGDLAANFPLAMLPDTDFDGVTAFVQRYPEEQVQPGASRTILHYVRTTYGNSDYKLPYGVSVDAPITVGLPASANGNLFPNPFPVRVNVDNVGGFGFDGKEFPLNDVRVKLSFPPNAGITVAGSTAVTPYELERTIAVVGIRQLRFTDFQATIGSDVSGNVPYTVTIDSQPGNVHKVINGVINVAARPRITLEKDANMVTLPYNFIDSSLETIFAPFLDPNVPGGDLQFYSYDPVQQGYVITTTAPKGRGFWAIYDKTGASSVIADYGGTPSQPSIVNPALIQLRGGFNMIGNPYHYRIPILQITGVSASAPQVSKTFTEMVDLGWVQSFVSYWDAQAKDYVFVPAEDGFLEPHRGYWINVLTTDDLTINYPDVYLPFVPGSNKKPIRTGVIRQTEQEWMLKLSARTSTSADSSNGVGVVRTVADVNRHKINEPPMAPTQDLGLSVRQIDAGKVKQMARAFSTQAGRNEWKLVVTAKKAGDVTITWPNLGQLPKNLRFTLKDAATNVSRSVRQTSGYTFRMDQPGTRELTLVSELGGSTAAVIGNVVVAGNTRVSGGSVTINYTLGADTTTSIRILSAKGQEVYSISRGRADRAGDNTVTWNLRNSANQAVAPGTYRVEIVAEGTDGNRARKIVPVNVIR
ncbi:MAG: FlgD immunoglobulin-like domain containing protein [Fimbriimonadaceae bacterium]